MQNSKYIGIIEKWKFINTNLLCKWYLIRIKKKKKDVTYLCDFFTDR